MTTRYCFPARVKKIEERFEKEHVSGVLAEAVMRDVSIGWWVLIDRFPVSISFGGERPDFAEGDIIDLTVMKRRSVRDADG